MEGAKEYFVTDLRPDQVFVDKFLVQHKESRLKKSGEPYLSLVLSDRTGQIEAKMWDGVAGVAQTFERDDFVKVKALVQVYRNKPQLTVRQLRRLDDEEVSVADFLPHTRFDVEEMWAELRGMISGMENADLRRLLEAFLDDPEIGPRFKRAPAAKSLHHAFVGGLLEHVLSLARLATRSSPNYAYIDFDLLLTGVVLHDIGKIWELEYHRAFGYSDEGQLIGHIVMATKMVDQKCRELGDFPDALRLLVEHMILGHHGKYEFGSPKLPAFPEALMLHYLDDLDSKLESMRAAAASEGFGEGPWTNYNPSLERSVLKKDRFLEGTAAPAAESEATPPATSEPAPETAASGSLFPPPPPRPNDGN